MSRIDSPATLWALEFLGQSLREGVRDVVVSPGSRSQSLALVADALSRDPRSGLHLHVAIDERSSGFLALGLSIDSRRPTILVSTSGSAPGHYLPALMEAKHSGIPLIALTADRPEELQGTGANQTTNQVGLFGTVVDRVVEGSVPEGDDQSGAREVARLVCGYALSGAPGGRSGPVQCNVAFREPLSRPISPSEINQLLAHDIDAAQIPGSDVAHSRTITLSPEEGTIVIAGHRAGPQAESLARDLGAPLVAEVHSGAHFGPHLIVAYRELLSDPTWLGQVKRVVTVGRPTLSRQVQALLARAEVVQVVLQRGEPEPANPSRNAEVVDEIVVSKPADNEHSKKWVGPWVVASREILEKQSAQLDPPAPDVDLASAEDMPSRAEFARAELQVFRRALSRRDIALGVWEATWPHDFLMVGSSRMIRELDGVAPGKNIPVWSNRGLSGIDGTIATARGIALSRAQRGESGLTRALLGDVAFLHDAGSLLLDSGEAESSRVQIVVVSDGGGSLFDLLEASQTADRESFDRVMFTPVKVNVEALAEAYSWSYQRVEKLGELSEALGNIARHQIVECVVER